MKRIIVVAILGIVYLTGLVFAMVNYHIKNENEMAERHLQNALNRSVDAAVEEMEQTADLQVDYVDWDKIKVDPEIAYQEFLDLFCFNYGYMPNSENKAEIECSFLPNFTVATIDGYYIAKPEVVKDNEGVVDYALQFSPKMDYTYKSAEASPITYSLNLSCNRFSFFDGNTVYNKEGRPETLKTDKEEIAAINKVLTLGIGTCINEINASKDDWENAFYLPGVLTNNVRTNPVEGPSVIALAQNVTWDTGRKVDAFSIGGGKLKRSNAVACYKRAVNGVYVNYYTYLSKLPPATDVIQVVMSPEEAAILGYACDTEYMK